MQIAKWGNSLAVRLPTKLCQTLGLKEGDQVELISTNTDRVFEVIPHKTSGQILEELRMFRGTLPSSKRLNREDANAR